MTSWEELASHEAIGTLNVLLHHVETSRSRGNTWRRVKEVYIQML